MLVYSFYYHYALAHYAPDGVDQKKRSKSFVGYWLLLSKPYLSAYRLIDALEFINSAWSEIIQGAEPVKLLLAICGISDTMRSKVHKLKAKFLLPISKVQIQNKLVDI